MAELRLYRAVESCRQLLRTGVLSGTAATECAQRWQVSTSEVLRLAVEAETACTATREAIRFAEAQAENVKPKGGRRRVTADY